MPSETRLVDDVRLPMTLPSTAAQAARSRRRKTEPEAVVAMVVGEKWEW